MDNTPYPLNKSWRYWGRRGGSIDRDGNRVFRVRSFKKTGASGNNHAPKTIYKHLAENAMALGYLNGIRITRGKH